ncbi:MAG: hypothetical protein GWP14_05040 [Actinobacteria bacterium]|nr:hypothetical protein [Actinomycetota bacterium]
MTRTSNGKGNTSDTTAITPALEEILNGLAANRTSWSRREFLRLAGVGAVALGATASGVAALVICSPNLDPGQMRVFGYIGPGSSTRSRPYVVKRVNITDYPSYRKAGYDCGSGPTESFCGTLTTRLKGRGMRWDRDNAEAIMALGSLYYSNAPKGRVPRARPWVNDYFLVSAIAEVRLALLGP